jgi:hypothetical protein
MSNFDHSLAVMLRHNDQFRLSFRGARNATHFIKTVGNSEDPMKSMALSGWIAGASRLKKSSLAHKQ